jgi:hypothetical protein
VGAGAAEEDYEKGKAHISLSSPDSLMSLSLTFLSIQCLSRETHSAGRDTDTQGKGELYVSLSISFFVLLSPSLSLCLCLAVSLSVS